MKITFIIISTWLISCTSGQQSKQTGEEKESASGNVISTKKNLDSLKEITSSQMSFLDSIAKKYELSAQQIRRHTSIDSVFYTGFFKDVNFKGDTLFDLRHGYKGAIINYDDKRSCIYKFLVIIIPTKDEIGPNKIIYSDCDHDASANYWRLRYKLLNDSSFQTIETFIPANSSIEKVNKLKWKITEPERIDTLY